MTTTIDPATDRAAWHEERRKGIGASEAPAVLGFSPFASPRQVYLDKLGELPPIEETEAMEWGTLLEPLLAAQYTRRTGIAIQASQVFLRSAEHPFLFATLDGMTEAGHPVELKTTAAWNAGKLGEDGTDAIPDHWLIQASQQMLVSETDRVDFAVLIGGQSFRTFTVRRDDALIATMVPALAEFWERVQRREPPPERHPADRRILHRLYPGCEGEIDLTADDAAAVDRWVELGKTLRDTEELRDTYRASILERLGNHAVGYLPDGRVVTRKIIEVPEKTVTKKAFSYVGMWIKKGA